MDPEMLNAASAPAAMPTSPAPDAAADSTPPPAEEDSGPLSKIELEPAEDGNVIATHHKKVPERVKHMDGAKPRKHALHKDEVEEHIKKHKGRLTQ
jgi:hypothetical protein